jgi:hypothetical protein
LDATIHHSTAPPRHSHHSNTFTARQIHCTQFNHPPYPPLVPSLFSTQKHEDAHEPSLSYQDYYLCHRHRVNPPAPTLSANTHQASAMCPHYTPHNNSGVYLTSHTTAPQNNSCSADTGHAMLTPLLYTGATFLSTVTPGHPSPSGHGFNSGNINKWLPTTTPTDTFRGCSIHQHHSHCPDMTISHRYPPWATMESKSRLQD